ncbi:MAG: copper chaperone PCu(A)C [Ramlibacter sp.]|nr:copper chaperone PCu(A)C [Ramlibacter sp.]
MNAFKLLRRLIGTSVCAAVLATPALAQPAAPAIKAEGVWARASVQGQRATGAFMTLTAREGTRLVGITTPVAGLAEVHEMKMEGDVMKMRAVPGLDLAPGKPVALKPGGHHVMLMDLKAPLAKGTSVPMTLVFKNGKGVEHRLVLSVPVLASAPGGSGAAGMKDMHKH